MTNDSKPQVPAWIWITGGIAMTLFTIGTVINPEFRSFNVWKLAGGIVGGAGFVTIFIWSISKRRKE